MIKWVTCRVLKVLKLSSRTVLPSFKVSTNSTMMLSSRRRLGSLAEKVRLSSSLSEESCIQLEVSDR